MPRRRSRSRSRSRSPGPKRMPHRRRSFSRSSSGSPGYRRKRKSSSNRGRYSRSPRPRRSRSFTPKKKHFSPPLRLQNDNQIQHDIPSLEQRLRDIQQGKAPFLSSPDGNRDNFVPNDNPLPPPPPAQFKPNYSQDQYIPKQEFTNTQSYGPPGQGQRELRRSLSPVRKGRRSFTPEKKSSRSRYKESKKRSVSPSRGSRKRGSSNRKGKDRSISPSSKSSKGTKKSKDGNTEGNAKPKIKSRYGPGIDPSLIVIPRRKDEGTTPIFDRPEIPVYTIHDDPSLKAEGYFGPLSNPVVGGNHGMTDSQRGRQPSPEVRFSATGLDAMKFPSSALFDKSGKTTTMTLGQIQDSLRDSVDRKSSLPSRNMDSGSSSDMRVAVRRQAFSPREGSYESDMLRRERILYEKENKGLSPPRFGSRAMSEDRRPVKERLGDKKDTGEMPDFRKEIELLDVPKESKYFMHDDRDLSPKHARSRSPILPPSNTYYQRGSRGRGFRGRRPFRGRFGQIRGFGRGYSTRDKKWTHDKFEDIHRGKDHSKKDKKKRHSSKDRERKKSH